MCLLCFKIFQSSFRLLLALSLANADGKIVVRALITKLLVDQASRLYITLTPLRGYGAAFKQAARTLAHVAGATACSLTMRALLPHIDQMARSAAAVTHAPITKHMATGRAVCVLGQMMLEQAQA